MVNFKRKAIDRDVTVSPSYSCFACEDTGIVTNPDGLLSAYLKGYDHDDNGIHRGGSDLAVICWCNAAYNVQVDGKVIQHGFREDSGAIRTVSNEKGKPLKYGVSCPKEVMGEIHTVRKAAWASTEKLMRIKREEAAEGKKPEPTDAMKAAREMLKPETWATSKTMSSFGDIARTQFVDERVQVVSPRDFIPAPDPLPVEPNQELDGITTLTNHPNPEDLPF